MELPWPEATSAAARFVAAIDAVATAALRALLGQLTSMGFQVDSIGVVGSPDRALERIGNPHIRAHAAEGMLFRHSLEVAAAICGKRAYAFSDRSLQMLPARELQRLGKEAGRPWRNEEKSAATAAWLVMCLSQ